MSPHQYELQGSEDPLAEVQTKAPLPSLMSIPTSPPPDFANRVSTPLHRKRINAVSQFPLQRSYAFRSPRCNAAFIKTPSPPPATVQPTLVASRKSRIPKPSTPSQVRTDVVTDLTDLPVPNLIPLRRSARHSTRVYYHSDRRPRAVMHRNRTSRHDTPQEEETDGREDPYGEEQRNEDTPRKH